MAKKEEKILIHRDDYKVTELELHEATFTNLLNRVVENWNELNLGNLETRSLSKALNTPKEFFNEVCLSHLPDEVMEDVGPFKKAKKKTLEGLELPNNFHFIAAAEEAYNYKVTRSPFTEGDFEIVGDKVQLKNREALYDLKSKIFAESQAAKEYHRLQQELLSSVKNLDAFTSKFPEIFTKGVVTHDGLNVELLFGFGIRYKKFLGPNGWETIYEKEASIKHYGYTELNQVKSIPLEGKNQPMLDPQIY